MIPDAFSSGAASPLRLCYFPVHNRLDKPMTSIQNAVIDTCAEVICGYGLVLREAYIDPAVANGVVPDAYWRQRVSNPLPTRCRDGLSSTRDSICIW